MWNCLALALVFATVPPFFGAPAVGGHTFVSMIFAVAGVSMLLIEEKEEEQ